MRCILLTLLVGLGVNAWRWDSPSLSGSSLTTRVGSSLVTYVSPGSSRPKLLVCGGVGSSGMPVGGCDVIDPFSSWKVSTAISAGRSPLRVDSASAVLGGYLVVWGGRGVASAESSGGCEVFNMETWTAAAGATCDLPPVTFGYCDRWGHTALAFGASIIVYGGAVNGPDGEPDRDVDDLKEEASLMILTHSGSGPSFSWSLPNIRFNRPLSRHYHAAALAPKGTAGSVVSRMLIHGGASFDTRAALSDTWQLTLNDDDAHSGYIWLQLVTLTNSTAALYGHTLLILGAELIAVGGQYNVGSGGVVERTINSGGDLSPWRSPSVTGAPPTSPFRSRAAIIFADGSSNPQAVLVGGAGRDGLNASGGVVVLSEIDVVAVPISSQVPYIVGGSMLGAVVLALFGYTAWRNGRVTPTDDALDSIYSLGSGAGGSIAIERVGLLKEAVRGGGAAGGGDGGGGSPPRGGGGTAATPATTAAPPTASRPRGRSRSSIKRTASMGSISADRNFDKDAELITDFTESHAADSVLRF